jgi:hypothetical protein
MRARFGIGMIAVLALPATREWLEREMITHMLVQIPLLVFAGVLLTAGITRSWQARIAAWNRLGIPGMLLAIFISSWWMVPRALDSVLASPIAELWKFVSLPLLVGVPLALSWGPLGTIGRGFVVANVLPMWAVVGWLYIAAPVRVCNYYLLDQQVVAGRGLLWASIAAGALTAAMSFRPGRPQVAELS